jgi:hypothetical protein
VNECKPLSLGRLKILKADTMQPLVWPLRYCSPRHPPYFEISFIELGGRAKAWCLLMHAEASLAH